MRCCLAAIVASVMWMLAGTAAVAQTAPTTPTAPPLVLADFADVSRWQALASDQVRAELRRDADGSLCLDVDFGTVSGYAAMQRELPLNWPEHFELVARLKGQGAVNDLQLKFSDASGDNVWWVNMPDAALPDKLADLKIRRRHVGFAWGPTLDRALRRTQTLELVVAAGRGGGRSSLCLARLTLQVREPDPAVWPQPVVQRRGTHMLVDLQRPREYSGVVLRWPAGAQALSYTLQASDDGVEWRELRRVAGSDGGLDTLFLPDEESRHLRLSLPAAAPTPALELRSPAEWPAIDAVLAEQARALPRGELPRAFAGEQNYWTLVGVDGGGERSGLMSEDGAVEVGRGGFSVEPAVLLDDGRHITWADVAREHTLRGGFVPVPRTRWRHPLFTLDVEAAADGPADAPELLVNYVLRNTAPRAQRLRLLLAVRPWQVNPPQQFLTTRGGARPLRSLRWDGRALAVDGLALRPVETPAQVHALALDGGLGLAALLAAPALTPGNDLVDPQAHASAALVYEWTLAPGEQASTGWVAGLGGPDGRAAGVLADAIPGATPGAFAGTVAGATAGGPLANPAAAAPGPPPVPLAPRIAAAAARWHTRLAEVALEVPAGAQRIVDSMRTALAHMLVSRDGPALRPGTRSYARTWVRDGAMMVAGLVRLGEADVAREFVDWYAGFVFDSGKVPCCVDRRGADPVTENDSHGQYLYAVAEVWRHTHDNAFLARHWPTVQRVVAWMEALRQSERSPQNMMFGRQHYFGLMPPSISHEGYYDKPAYSYWDNFWALRGYKDAVLIARTLGYHGAARRFSGWRDEFARELAASIEATGQAYGQDVVAGAADRGDFDATSTTMALNPAQADAVSAARLQATFERYWLNAERRARGAVEWRDYTPYELRTVGALVRLGQPARAHAMLRFFFGHQRPTGWNQWAEVVLPDAREPRFLGDMPHAWVASDYVRSALDLFAFERERDERVVIGAGWAPLWRVQGVGVRGLSTPWGALSYRLVPELGGWLLQLEQTPGERVRLAWPEPLPLPYASVDGRPLAWSGRELALPGAPAVVRLLHAAPPETAPADPFGPTDDTPPATP